MGRSPEAKQRRRQREKQRLARRREEGRHNQNGKPCTYCARPMSIGSGALYPTKDHVEPRSRGGKITVWACQTCNHVKRDMTVDEWAIYRASHDEWWRTGRRANNAANWTPRPNPDNLASGTKPPMPCETGPEAQGIEAALTA